MAVVERAPEEERGGATRYTSSWFRITEDRRLDPGFVALMESVSGGLADLDYCRTLEREVPATLDFLEGHGVEVIYARSPLPNRHAGGGGTPVGGGAGIVEAFAGILERTDGVELIYETEAVRLSVAGDGRVDGVVVRGRDGLLRTLGAGAVVIASGGFEGSNEMLTQYLGGRAGDLPLIAPGLANNRGEGIRMAMEVGADTAGQFDMFHGEPVDPRASKPDPVFFPYVCGIVVNGRGERFFDEGQDGFDATFEALGYEIWRNQEQTAFFVGDQTTLAIERFDAVVLTDVPPVTAGSVEELADATRPRPGRARAHRGRVQRRGRAGSVRPVRLRRQEHDGPRAAEVELGLPARLAAVRRVPAHVRDHVHVRRYPHGQLGAGGEARPAPPIPGLYAAGEVTGLYYNEYPAGTSVLRSLTFGRLAGVNAARETDGSR